MQRKIKVNNIEIKQPDKCDPVLTTTSTDDSDRKMDLVMQNTPIGTIYGYDMEWSNLTLSQCSIILKNMVNKASFKMYHLSPYHGEWRTDDFYASNYDVGASTFEDGVELWSSLTINVRGINPLC